MRTLLCSRRVWTITTIGIMLLLVACSAAEPTPTPVPPTPEIVAVLEVTFDGNECACNWPEVISPGEISIIFNNKSQVLTMARMMKLDEGKTWDDMLTYMGPPPSPTHRPEWASGVIDAQAAPGNSISHNKRLSGGLYGVVCLYGREPPSVWPGAPLYVED
jgi:hypothetical protein